VTIPYSFFSPRYVKLYHQLGAHDKANQIAETISKRSLENLEYLMEQNKNMEDLRQKSMMILQSLAIIYRELEQEAGQNLENVENGLELIQQEDASDLSTEELLKLRDMYSDKAVEYSQNFYDIIEQLELENRR
jgi:uncharacterized FlgJ-related protein